MRIVTNPIEEGCLPTDPEFQTWVKGLLHDSHINRLCITFTKSDGTDRDLFCTLIESNIPSDKAPKGTGREAPTTTQRVFDVDKQEWRSFKWEAVKTISYFLGE